MSPASFAVQVVGALLCGLASLGGQTASVGDWPGESEAAATNLSALCDGFRKDLSGAVWNPHTRTLWLCRNGSEGGGRLWRLAEDADGELALDVTGAAEWRGLGDVEGVTFADFREPVVFVIVEGAEVIHELDVSNSEQVVLLREYDTSAYLPRAGTDGAEALTFVPDEFLARAGFVDLLGMSRVSQLGMGGLMLVGHQNGGGVFAFDLDRATGDVDFVGEYRVAPEQVSGPGAMTAVAGLEFDRSTGELLVWHQLREHNLLAIVELGSTAVPGEFQRAFARPRLFAGPSGRNCEGLAIAPVADCGPAGRRLFLTVDDGKRHALFAFEQFEPGCVIAAEPLPLAPAADAAWTGSGSRE